MNPDLLLSRNRPVSFTSFKAKYKLFCTRVLFVIYYLRLAQQSNQRLSYIDVVNIVLSNSFCHYNLSDIHETDT